MRPRKRLLVYAPGTGDASLLTYPLWIGGFAPLGVATAEEFAAALDDEVYDAAVLWMPGPEARRLSNVAHAAEVPVLIALRKPSDYAGIGEPPCDLLLLNAGMRELREDVRRMMARRRGPKPARPEPRPVRTVNAEEVCA